MLEFDDFHARMLNVIHPEDGLIRELGIEDAIKHAWVKYRVSWVRNPKKIVELGVRAGYSGYAMLLASGGASYVGYDGDVDGNGKKFREWAIKILGEVGSPIDYVDINTQQIVGVEKADLYHVDADHSYAGALHEIKVCFKSAPVDAWILVDDYDFMPSVKQAVTDFLATEQSALFFSSPSWRGEALLIKQW
jgi:hypothetical protein